MSLKGIELQIAIPKTFEAGKVSEQKQQQSQVSQDFANHLTAKDQMKNRETVVKSDQTARTDADAGDGQTDWQPSERESKEEKDKEEKMVHPYKGAFVDFTG